MVLYSLLPSLLLHSTKYAPPVPPELNEICIPLPVYVCGAHIFHVLNHINDVYLYRVRIECFLCYMNTVSLLPWL